MTKTSCVGCWTLGIQGTSKLQKVNRCNETHILLLYQDNN